MRKNKYDDKFNHQYKIRKIVHTKDNDDSGLIEPKPSVRIIRHTDQNTFTTKIAKSGIEHEQSTTEKFTINPLSKSSSATKTKISKLLLKSQVKKVSSASNKSSKNYINKPTKAIVKSITTYTVDPYLFARQKRNAKMQDSPVATSVTKENNRDRNLSQVAMMKDDDEVMIVLDNQHQCDDDKESIHNKPPVASVFVNYQLGDVGDDDTQKNVKSVVDDHEMNRNFLINTIKKPAGDVDVDDEEMSPSHLFVTNRGLVATATTNNTDNSSKKSLFVMHNNYNNGTNDAGDREKENYHDNNGNPQQQPKHLIDEKKSPYELTPQNNFKSMNLNLSPVISTNFNNNNKAPSSVICPKMLKTSLGSGATNVIGSVATKNANQVPSSPNHQPIDREAAREFIRKQQEQRKAMETARKANNEKEVIRKRLEALKKRTRNLVQHNVEKKKTSKKGNLEKNSIKENDHVKKDSGRFLTKKSPVKQEKHSDRSVMSKVSPKRGQTPVKTVDKTSMLSRSDLANQKIVKESGQGLLHPKELAKNSHQALGLLRKGNAPMHDDLYSPLKIHDATVSGLRDSLGQTFINKTTHNQTYGDLTLDPNATSFIIHENSQDEEKPEVKEKVKKSPETAKPGIPEWLKETPVQQYPYNFITALKKKLAAALEETNPFAVSQTKDTKKAHEKYLKMAYVPEFINNKREYDSCSFTEVGTDLQQENLAKEINKGKKEDRREMGRGGHKRDKENIEKSADQSISEQYTSISSPLQNFSPNNSLFTSKYKHQHRQHLHKNESNTTNKITVTDPNTISEITSLKSEAPQIFANPTNQIKRQVEGGPAVLLPTKCTINPKLDPIPLYYANGNENSSNQRQIDRYANEFKINVVDTPKNVKSSSQKIDNEIPLSNHKSDGEDENAKRMIDEKTNDNPLDETYARLLLEFKQSLNNFIELNQKLHSAVKIQKSTQQAKKLETRIPSLSHNITTRDDGTDLENNSHNLSSSSKKLSNIEKNRTTENQKIITPTKYSSSFESSINSHANDKNVVERLSSSSSSNNTATTTTTTGHDQSPDKTKAGRKSDFYEPQRFEMEFGEEWKGDEAKDQKSVEEIILESSVADESSSKSFPILRKDIKNVKNTDISVESSSQKLEGQDSILNSLQLPPKISEDKQSTSAGDETTTSNNSKTPNNSEDKTSLEQKDTVDDRTDTEIESLPIDNKYESEFETEATESAVESSILEMSFNESNLNFSYSTVGMIDQMIYSEERKSEQISAIIGVKTKSIIDRLKGQISFLEVKKQRCKGTGQPKEAQSIRKKQRAILMKLDQAKTSLKKICEAEGRNILQPIQPRNNFGRDLVEKLLKRNVNLSAPEISVPKTPVKGFEIEPSYVLERLLEKRQRELEARRKKLEKLSQWQAQLDEEERRIIQMEQQLIETNINEARRSTRSCSSTSEVIASRSERRLKSRAIEENKENQDEMAVKLSQIENSLSLLQEVRDDVDDNVVLTGVKLNKLWFRLSGQKERKFDPSRVYDLDKKRVSELYEEAKNVVLSQFEDKNRVKQMLEVSKLQETASEIVQGSQIQNKEGSSTTEASSVLDIDDVDSQGEPEIPEPIPEQTMEADMTLTEENIEKMVPPYVEAQESLNKSSTTPISIEEEVIPEASSTGNDAIPPISDLSYSDTFNNTEISPEQDEETFIDNISFPKFDTTTFHNETFIEKSLEKSEPSIHEDINDPLTHEVPEEVLTVAHSAPSSSSSSIISHVDPPSESDEALLIAAINTIKVTPKVSSPTSVSLEYKLPDIINEAEVLRRQQMQIEQEIEQLQQQVPFVYLRDIPNKPPPPYTLPLQESKDKFPSPTTIATLVKNRVENLYRLKKKQSSLLNGTSSQQIEKTQDESLNIYERLIIDVSEEYFYSFDKTMSSEKQTGVIKNSLVFFNPPNELECLQSFINKKVEKICDPLVRDLTLSMAGLDDFGLGVSQRSNKKDLVDEILMQELVEEDALWTYFEEEEIVVKNDLVNGILKMLVDEAMTELIQIVT